MLQITSYIIGKLGLHVTNTTNDDQLMENLIDSQEIKFHLNENIEWHFMQLEYKLLNGI